VGTEGARERVLECALLVEEKAPAVDAERRASARGDHGRWPRCGGRQDVAADEPRHQLGTLELIAHRARRPTLLTSLSLR
jgi:hypothetical protein